MGHKTFYLFGLIIAAINAFGQPDCTIRLEYKGTILSDTVNIDSIGIATTRFLAGYTTVESELSFYKTAIKKNEISALSLSHMSSDFCQEPDLIIEDVFMGDRKFYPVKLYSRGLNQWIEVNFPIEKITFGHYESNKRRIIVIDFGDIII